MYTYPTTKTHVNIKYPIIFPISLPLFPEEPKLSLIKFMIKATISKNIYRPMVSDVYTRELYL